MNNETLSFCKDRTEIQAFKSKALPGSVVIMISGPTQKTVWDMIKQFTDNSASSSFMAPVKCPDKMWNAMGRIRQ